jgi:SRSO17 transposase
MGTTVRELRGASVIEIRAPGRTENCQIGVFAAYTSTAGRALVDRELYLPKSWTDDRDRCRAAKVPDQREFATKNTLAATIVRRALASPLPIAWVTADAAYGQDNRFRRMLETSGVGYVLAVPKSQFSLAGPRIDRAFEQAPDQAWERRSCGPARRDSASTTGRPSNCGQWPSTTIRTAC